MSLVQGIALLAGEIILCVAAILVILRTGFARLESAIGILRDGLPMFAKAPSWRLPDLEDRLHAVPSVTSRWQFLLFADHSLINFPNLIQGINHISQEVDELEVLVLARGDKALCEKQMASLQLQIPIIPVTQVFYNRFKTRVMPYVILLDPQGFVRWTGLVNTEAEVFLLWQLSHDAYRQNR